MILKKNQDCTTYRVLCYALTKHFLPPRFVPLSPVSARPTGAAHVMYAKDEMMHTNHMLGWVARAGRGGEMEMRGTDEEKLARALSLSLFGEIMEQRGHILHLSFFARCERWRGRANGYLCNIKDPLRSIHRR